MSAKPVVYFIDDSATMREVIKIAFNREEMEVITCHDASSAMDLMEHSAPDVVISDVIMPGLDGPTLLKKARKFLGAAPVMFISGYAEAEFSDLLEGETGVTFLPKPLDIKVLAERVKQQLAA